MSRRPIPRSGLFGALFCTILIMTLTACQMAPKQPIDTVEFVDLDRFMGDWYVLASIPTRIEKNAYNALESYKRGERNRIETTFRFREGSFDGELKRYEPTGFVKDTGSNAVWGMQFIWPFKADYRVLYVDEDYTRTIIGRQKRDYVWIMARSPQIPRDEYDRLVALVAAQGYDPAELREVPQQWD